MDQNSKKAVGLLKASKALSGKRGSIFGEYGWLGILVLAAGTAALTVLQPAFQTMFTNLATAITTGAGN